MVYAKFEARNYVLTPLQALAELSCSDGNKVIMGSVRIVQLLARSLRLFVESKPSLTLVRVRVRLD